MDLDHIQWGNLPKEDFIKGYNQIDPKLPPGQYILFTDEDDLETYHINLKDITHISLDFDDNPEEAGTITIETLGDQYRIMGGYYLIEIK